MTLSKIGYYWTKGWRSAVFAGILGTGIRVGANLLLLPIVLIKLSKPELALWWVFIALGNFGNLADFGFGATIPRNYNYLLAGAEDFNPEGVRAAPENGTPNLDGIGRMNVAVRSLYLKISLTAIALLAIGGSLSLLRPVAGSGLAGRAWICWFLYTIAIGYNLGTSHWVLALQGLNRVRELQFVYVMGGLTFMLCAGTLLICRFGLMSIVVATFARGFVMHGRCHQIYRKIVPAMHHPCRCDPIIVKKLWPNAWKFGVLSIGSFCIYNGNVIICSQLLGDTVTASFGLTAQIGNYLANFSAIWLLVKWPEISILRAQGRTTQMAELFARRLKLVMISFLGLAFVILLCGNALLEWKGTDKRLLETPYLVFYFLYLTQQVFYVQFGGLALTENVVPFFKVSLFTGIGVVVASLSFTRLFGLWGLLIAPLMVEVACSSWYTVRCGFKGQPLSVRQFCRAFLFAGL